MMRGISKARRHLAQEAARLMYEEEVSQYFVAKRMAAKRLFGRTGGKRVRFRPADLPSNGEIQEALLCLADLTEGDGRRERLDEMRRLALEVMRALERFEPRLIGSVATGHIRRGSDVDIQLFADDRDAPEAHLRALGWAYERDDVLIRRPSGWCEYQHLRLDLEHPITRVAPLRDGIPTPAEMVVEATPSRCRPTVTSLRSVIELTVYDRTELRVRPRSSTDGQPIERLSIRAVEALLGER